MDGNKSFKVRLTPSQSFMVRLTPRGRPIDLATESGANTYLKKKGSKLHWQLKKANDLDRKIRPNSKEIEKLNWIYTLLAKIALHADPKVFRENVAKEDVAVWLQHGVKVFRTMDDVGKFHPTNFFLFNSFLGLARHAVPAATMLYEDLTILKIVGETLQTGAKVLYKQAVGKLTISWVHNLMNCARNEFDNPWTPKKVFQKLEATGFLELFLTWAADPSITLASANQKTATLDLLLDLLLDCATFVKKRFRQGTPLGVAVRQIIKEKGEEQPTVCPVALPYYHKLIRLSDGHPLCMCQHCEKKLLSDEMSHCSKCHTNYCSKSCQKGRLADAQKDLLLPTSFQMMNTSDNILWLSVVAASSQESKV
mmetsp:Transcript_21057/g.51809  ORF Transcript_21057/g.51809 Transcript_21057/m.51809 type:complete len:367 (-) Transcript_21057:18-1118(-)